MTLKSLNVVTNPYNLLVAWRVFRVVQTPLLYLRFLITGIGSPTILVLTPIGEIAIRLRNRAAARTFFSIFLREDYPLSEDHACGVLDVGSNIGLSALYFLSRHHDNKVFCVEPDPGNIPFLKENLAPYAARTTIISEACSTGQTGEMNFYVVADGKYSSLLSNEFAYEVIQVAVRPLEEIVDEAFVYLDASPLIIKVDIEGLEREALLSLPAEKLTQFQMIFIEELGIGDTLGNGWKTCIRAGYVEMIERTGEKFTQDFD